MSATYSPGDIVEVQWCLDHNGDHGGMFTYRICQDQELVDKFLDADYLPTEDEKQAAEDCFEAGTLSCNDVDGQECDYSPDCQDGEACWNNDWFTCNAFDGTKCQGVDNAELNSCYTSIAGGYTVTKKVKIPEYVSNHTLLQFKWNSFQTPQIYLSCADIAITGDGQQPPSTTTGTAPSTTTTKSGTSSTCKAGATVDVTFNQIVTTNVGQTVKIVGSIPELGNWDTSSAPALSASGYTSSNHLWSYTVALATGRSFEYKFINVDSSGGVTWESDPNRSYTVPSTCDSSVTVASTWR